MSVERVLQLGDDQLASQFQLVFPVGIPGGGDVESIALRMDQSIDPPEEAVGTYTIPYKGLKVMKTNKNEANDKTFSFDIRLDQKWKVYQDLKKWKRMVHDPLNGTALPDSLTRVPIVFQALDGANQVVQSIVFNNAKITTIKLGTLSNESEDPERLTLTFIYGTCDIS